MALYCRYCGIVSLQALLYYMCSMSINIFIKKKMAREKDNSGFGNGILILMLHHGLVITILLYVKTQPTYFIFAYLIYLIFFSFS